MSNKAIANEGSLEVWVEAAGVQHFEKLQRYRSHTKRIGSCNLVHNF